MFKLNLIGYADEDVVIVCSNCKMLANTNITPKCKCVTKAQFNKARDLFYMYEQALKDILYTTSYLKREAESSGSKFDGSEAVVLSNNSNFLKGIAQDALTIGEKT